MVVTDTFGARPKRSRIGVYDKNILCASCDNEFNEFDQPAKETLLSGNKSTVLTDRGNPLVFEYVDSSAVAIAKFALSVLLRASWSNTEFFRSVNLGPYENIITQYLFDGVEKPSCLDVLLAEYDLPTVPTMDPHETRFDGVRFWWLGADRFEFYIRTDKKVTPNALRNISLFSREKAFSIVRSWRESKQRAVAQDLTKKIENRYGKLWK